MMWRALLKCVVLVCVAGHGLGSEGSSSIEERSGVEQAGTHQGGLKGSLRESLLAHEGGKESAQSGTTLDMDRSAKVQVVFDYKVDFSTGFVLPRIINGGCSSENPEVHGTLNADKADNPNVGGVVLTASFPDTAMYYFGGCCSVTCRFGMENTKCNSKDSCYIYMEVPSYETQTTLNMFCPCLEGKSVAQKIGPSMSFPDNNHPEATVYVKQPTYTN